MNTKTFLVEGMTCDHCVSAVTSEVGKVDGVEAVNVNLKTKLVEVSGDRFDDNQVIAAIDQAGYEGALL